MKMSEIDSVIATVWTACAVNVWLLTVVPQEHWITIVIGNAFWAGVQWIRAVVAHRSEVDKAKEGSDGR